MITTHDDLLTFQTIRLALEELWNFLTKHSSFRMSFYVMCQPVGCKIWEEIHFLLQMDENNGCGTRRIFYSNEEDEVQKKSAGTEDVEEVMNWVRDNLKKNNVREISRAAAADHIHVSPEYLSRIFKEKTGKTFKDFVLEEKMKMAATLLTETKLSVGIISSKLGYDNFSHFSSMFKQYYQCTPLEYRKNKTRN